jgi:hypothetical protein
MDSRTSNCPACVALSALHGLRRADTAVGYVPAARRCRGAWRGVGRSPGRGFYFVKLKRPGPWPAAPREDAVRRRQTPSPRHRRAAARSCPAAGASTHRRRRFASHRAVPAGQTDPGPSRVPFRESLGRFSQSLTRWPLTSPDRHTGHLARNPIYATRRDSPVLNPSRSYGAGSIRSRHDVCDGPNLTVVHCREAPPRHRRSLQRVKRPAASLHE